MDKRVITQLLGIIKTIFEYLDFKTGVCFSTLKALSKNFSQQMNY